MTHYIISDEMDRGYCAVVAGVLKGELIRCKDCEHHGTRTNMCDIWHRNTSGDGFCHRAKAVNKND